MGATDCQYAYRAHLVFQGVTIALLSDQGLPEEAFIGLRDDITETELGKAHSPSEPDGRLIYVATEAISVEYCALSCELFVRGPLHLFRQGSALAYIAQYMAECLRATKTGMLLIHAAAVRPPDDGNSYVIFGEKGAGKTTVALRLCHQYGYRLIGNDQVFLGPKGNSLVTMGGTAWFNVRQTAIRADPYLAQLLPDISSEGKPLWNSKIRVEPDQIGVTIEARECPLGGIFHLRVDHTEPDLYVAPWIGTQRNLILHERLGRHVTGQATPLQDDFGNYLGSLPPINLEGALRARDQLVRLVIKAGVTEIFAPSGEIAVDYIVNRANR